MKIFSYYNYVGKNYTHNSVREGWQTGITRERTEMLNKGKWPKGQDQKS